jgi:anti-anti-sigma factor
MTDDPTSRRQPPARRPPGDAESSGRGLTLPADGIPPVLDQVFDTNTLYALRAAVAAHAHQAGLPHGRAEDLVMAVHELAANAVRHGPGHGRLRLWKLNQAMYAEITDDGPETPPGTNADAGPEPGQAATWPAAHGHGLWLVRQLADQAEIQAGPHGTTATLSFDLGPSGPLPAFALTQGSQRSCTILTVTGYLDPDAAEQLLNAISDLTAAKPARHLILDLAGLAVWDSSLLAALITAQQRIVNTQPAAQMILVGIPGLFVQRLRNTSLGTRASFAETIDDAIRQIAQHDSTMADDDTLQAE